jgi:hypothetical protein
MATPQAPDYQLASQSPSVLASQSPSVLASQSPCVLTCTNHPTVFGDHKCDRCQKIICLQCYTRWGGPNTGVCPQCFQALSQKCCKII